MFSKTILVMVCCLISVTIFGQTKQDELDHWLPSDFKVNTGESMTILPTINHYKGKNGGYVAVYSHQKEGSVYSVGGDIYVVGQIRLKGVYEGRIFIPKGCEGIDISAMTYFKKMAGRFFPAFKGKAWVGGDTGGWFGY